MYRTRQWHIKIEVDKLIMEGHAITSMNTMSMKWAAALST